jgi:hypothetical protein
MEASPAALAVPDGGEKCSDWQISFITRMPYGIDLWIPKMRLCGRIWLQFDHFHEVWQMRSIV